MNLFSINSQCQSRDFAITHKKKGRNREEKVIHLPNLESVKSIIYNVSIATDPHQITSPTAEIRNISDSLYEYFLRRSLWSGFYFRISFFLLLFLSLYLIAYCFCIFVAMWFRRRTNDMYFEGATFVLDFGKKYMKSSVLLHFASESTCPVNQESKNKID